MRRPMRHPPAGYSVTECDIKSLAQSIVVVSYLIEAVGPGSQQTASSLGISQDSGSKQIVH